MKQHQVLSLVGVVVLVGVIAGFTIAFNRTPPGSNQTKSASRTAHTNKTTKTGEVMELQKTDETVGTGAEAQTGNTVSVNYLGTLTNGTKFDSSYDRNQPFSFKLGGQQVIKGWDQGVVGMKVGGKRKLVIPADLAYGSQSPSPAIPPNSTLVFEIELLDVK